jgi:hypothetical protein
MPQQNNNVKESLLKLEKIAKKILRKSLKDNTLDYTIQFTMSSMEPGKVKYATQISSPAKGVQPITFIFDKFEDLEASLKEAVDGIDRRKVELTFHESRIDTYKSKIAQHENRMEKLNDPNYDEIDDNIEMEEVS